MMPPKRSFFARLFGKKESKPSHGLTDEQVSLLEYITLDYTFVNFGESNKHIEDPTRPELDFFIIPCHSITMKFKYTKLFVAYIEGGYRLGKYKPFSVLKFVKHHDNTICDDPSLFFNVLREYKAQRDAEKEAAQQEKFKSLQEYNQHLVKPKQTNGQQIQTL